MTPEEKQQAIDAILASQDRIGEAITVLLAEQRAMNDLVEKLLHGKPLDAPKPEPDAPLTDDELIALMRRAESEGLPMPLPHPSGALSLPADILDMARKALVGIWTPSEVRAMLKRDKKIFTADEIPILDATGQGALKPEELAELIK